MRVKDGAGSPYLRQGIGTDMRRVIEMESTLGTTKSMDWTDMRRVVELDSTSGTTKSFNWKGISRAVGKESTPGTTESTGHEHRRVAGELEHGRGNEAMSSRHCVR